MNRSDHIEINEYKYLLEKINRIRLRFKFLLLLEGLLILISFFLFYILLAFITDNIFHLPSLARFIIFLTLLGLIIALIIILINPLLKKFSYEYIAIKIEKKHPEIKNKLINALQLAEPSHTSLPKPLLKHLLKEAYNVTPDIKISNSYDFSKLKKTSILFFITVAVLLTYILLFSTHFKNALIRTTYPFTYTTPISLTTLTVSPGDTLISRNSQLKIIAEIKGKIPKSANIFFKSQKKTQKAEMDFSGRTFNYSISNISQDMKYKVEAGDSESRWFQIKVVDKPEIKNFSIHYFYPDYTGKENEVINSPTGDIKALSGTDVEISAVPNKTVREAFAFLNKNQELPLTLSEEKITINKFTIAKNEKYTIKIKDEHGFENFPYPEYSIISESDSPPTIYFTTPKNDIEVSPDTALPISFTASDDFGLQEIKFIYHKKGDNKEVLLDAFKYNNTKKAIESTKLDLNQFKENTSILIFLSAKDNDPVTGGNTTQTRPIEIKILSKDRAMSELKENIKSIIDKLKTIIATEEKAKSTTEKILPTILSTQFNLDAFQKEINKVSDLQKEISQKTDDVISITPSKYQSTNVLRNTLISLSNKELRDILKNTELAILTEFKSARHNALKKIQNDQEQVISTLTELISQLSQIASAIEKGDELPKLSEEEMTKTLSEKDKELVELMKDLKKFVDDQSNILDETKGLLKEDLKTPSEEIAQKIQELAEIEDQWANILKNAFSDLSKLPETEAYDTALRDELVEIYSEIEKAAKELYEKNITLAVTKEQVTLELAKELISNTERWLPDIPDNLKWILEEPLDHPEVPLATLPDELTDIIGNLIMEEEDMVEEIEDVSSSYADSLDKGVGWDTMDGPISNFSAKGVTGNTLPNNIEVSGRSGEGRTGRSHGEFVEKTATGKGGRKTPTRLIEEPYESGIIEDTSTEPAGGATGGGKQSGFGGEGLTGRIPPPLQEETIRLANKQADIRNRAQRINTTLKMFEIESEDFTSGINVMRQLEDNLKMYRYDNLSDLNKAVIKNLKAGQMKIAEKVNINIDKFPNLRKDIKFELIEGSNEVTPEGYEELVKNYFRQLAIQKY